MVFWFIIGDFEFWYHISKVQGRKIILIFEKKKKKIETFVHSLLARGIANLRSMSRVLANLISDHFPETTLSLNQKPYQLNKPI